MSIFGITPHQMKMEFKASNVNILAAITLQNDTNNYFPEYEIRMDCGHRHIWDARKIATGAVEARFDVETGTKQDYYVCPKCSAPRENGVTDFCMQSVLHNVLSARKVTPLERRAVVLQR